MKKDKNLRWLATTKEAITQILQITSTTKGKNSLQLPDIQVLLYAIKTMDYDNKTKFPKQKDLGNELGITARRISMAVTKLQKLGFFTKVKKEAKTYYVNPFYFYIGDYRDLHHKYEIWKKLRPDVKKEDNAFNNPNYNKKEIDFTDWLQ